MDSLHRTHEHSLGNPLLAAIALDQVHDWPNHRGKLFARKQPPMV